MSKKPLEPRGERNLLKRNDKNEAAGRRSYAFRPVLREVSELQSQGMAVETIVCATPAISKTTVLDEPLGER
jgi:hypothetical protein